MKRVCSWILSLALLAGTLSTPALAELVPAESAPPPVEQAEQPPAESAPPPVEQAEQPPAESAPPPVEQTEQPTAESAPPPVEQAEQPPAESVPPPMEQAEQPPAESAPQVSLLTLAPGEVVGGQCGDNLTWELAESTGTLTISGTGAMWDYSLYKVNSVYISTAPWYAYTDQLRRLVLADSVTTIGRYAFYRCSGFTGNLTLPSGLTTIGERAFCGCSGFTGNLIIPSGVTTISGFTFYDCSGLTSNLTLPDGVTTIGHYAFSGCSGFTGNLTLPSGVTTIGERAFSGCSGFTGNLIIPSGVTTIGEYAFRYCYGFTGNLTIHNEVTTIRKYAFEGCSGFAGSLTLPSGLTTIEYGVFYGCSGFTGSLILPNGLTKISGEAFRNCSGFTGNLIIPSGVTTISGFAFYDCTGFAGKLMLPSGLTAIWRSAFSGCSGLTGNLTLPSGLTTIDNSAFDGCSGLTGNLTIPSGMTTIKSGVFYGCSGLTGNLMIPSGVTTIGVSAFCDCSGLTGNLTLPDGLTTIGNFAFSGCSGLTGNLMIPSGVTTIGVSAFCDCSGLTGNLTIPSGVTTIESDVFSGCSGLTGNLTIPSGVTTIGNSAFFGCSGLTGNLTLPSGVTRIENRAFTNCSGFTGNLTMPSGVTTIGARAFLGCSGLTSAQFMGNAPTEIRATDLIYPSFPIALPLYYNPATTGWTTPTWNGYQTIPMSMDTVVDENTSIYDAPTGLQVLTIYENKKGSEKLNNDYQLSQGASVTIGNVTHVTDKHGRMTLGIPGDGITVSKAGYLSRRLTAEQVRENPTIYLQKASAYPVLNALWVGGTKDVLNGSYPLDLLSDQVLQLSAEVDWGSSSAQSLMLRQGAKTIPFSGTTLSARLADSFDVGKPICILATAADGKQSQKELGFVQSGAAAALSGFQVSFRDKIKVKLPENIPFFGGDEVGAAIYTPLEVIVEVENGKIYGAIGARRDIAYKEGKWSAKSFSQSLKDAKGSAEKLKNFKKTYKDHLKTMEGKCGFAMGFSAMGFAEGYIDSSGQIIWLDTGILLEGKAKLDGSAPFTVGPVPLFLEWELSGKAEAALELHIDEAIKQFAPCGTISGEVKLGGGLGVGVSKALSASGGANGKLVPTWEINIDKPDYFKLVASLNFYAKVNAAFFEYKHPFNPVCEAVWAEYPSAGSLGALSVGDVSLYDTEQYVLSGREYLNQPSEFLANDGALSLLSSASTTGISTVVSNVYPQTEPQLVLFRDGTKLAVWVADDGTAGTNNRSALYYSYYNGTVWATPAPVQKDGTADFAPQLIVGNNIAYLAWQDAATTFADAATLEDMAQQMDISVGVFDGTTHSFTCQRFENANVDLLPTLCAADGGVHVVWSNNGANDWFGKNNTNSILSSSYSSGQWSVPTVRHSGLNSMNSVSADCTGGVLSIAYCVDGDNNLDDVTDMELYLNGEKISANAVPDTGATFQGGKLYWYSGGNVFRLDAAKQSTALLPPGTMPTDLFEIVEQGATKALLYTQGSGLYSTLKAVFYDAGTDAWSEPVALTDGTSFIRSFSGALTGDGKLSVLFNQTAVTGDMTVAEPYGQTNLMLLEATLHADISVGEIFVDQSAYVVGNTLPLQFPLTNNGELTANGCIVEILDSANTVLSTQLYDKPLLPGQMAEVTAYYSVTAVSPQTSLQLRVSPMGGTDTNLADNSALITLRYVDVALENMAVGRSETNQTNQTVVYANVVNRGCTELSNLTVTLRKDTANSVAVETKSIAALAPLAVEAVSFEVPEGADQLYFITVDGCTEDSQRSNNTDFVLLEAQNKISAKLLALEQDFIELSLQNNPACNLMVAAYDASGKLLTVGEAQVAADTEIVHLPVAGLDKNAVKTCKVFFFNTAAKLQPLCAAKELTNSAG